MNIGHRQLIKSKVTELNREIELAIAEPTDFPMLFRLYFYCELKIEKVKGNYYLYYNDYYFNIFKKEFDDCLEYFFKKEKVNDMKRYYKKTIIYAEEIVKSKKGTATLTTGSFETTEDITHKKKELIEAYGHF